MTAAITTVIPTYRRPALLRRAVRSALAQTYRDLCVVVVDNASGDETSAVVAELARTDPRVEYYSQASNAGALANWVYGMSRVETPFFSLLSDDDVLFPEFYATALRALEAAPQALMFAGSTLEFDDVGRLGYVPLAFWPREGVYQPDEAVRRMLFNRHPTWTGVVFRKEALQRAGPLDGEIGAAADVDFEMRVAARAPMIVSFAPCAAWVRHSASVTGGEGPAVVVGYEKMAKNVSAIDDLSRETRDELVTALRRQAALKLLEVGIKAQVRGDAAMAREAARRLHDDYGQRGQAALVRAVSSVCAALPPAQALLRWLEAQRLRERAASSRRRAARSAPDLARYAEYLKM